ncbi:hypothetical protein AB1399_07410 [Hydrogenibacillus schlegelii]|uniref:Uncharacterized protein n=1 Tax=Hydrogenibacillus schlegelii TaxID=1484 RepID=A0A132MG39_HYDSH|nr:hypothetical protein [Hydrogenibacillus schlegelii]KWW96749.1 hypothetical protein TR75_12255 [Hydrogenibacillus schlegelii]OAR05390.1 hypothetical protein SA87_10840 [Hydrogenibacillus schlegelii]
MSGAVRRAAGRILAAFGLIAFGAVLGMMAVATPAPGAGNSPSRPTALPSDSAPPGNSGEPPTGRKRVILRVEDGRPIFGEPKDYGAEPTADRSDARSAGEAAGSNEPAARRAGGAFRSGDSERRGMDASSEAAAGSEAPVMGEGGWLNAFGAALDVRLTTATRAGVARLIGRSRIAPSGIADAER